MLGRYRASCLTAFPAASSAGRIALAGFRVLLDDRLLTAGDSSTPRASTARSCSSSRSRTTRTDPRDDLDLASPGIVKVLENRYGDTYPDMRWEPKAAFAALADSYGT